MEFQVVPTPKSLKGYLRSLIQHFKLDIEGEPAEMSGGTLIGMISEDEIGISECDLQLAFIDTEDIAKAGTLKLLKEAAHARQDLLEQVQRRTQH